jgi:hypothetical protein
MPKRKGVNRVARAARWLSETLKRENEIRQEKRELSEAARGFVRDVLRRYWMEAESRGLRAIRLYREDEVRQPARNPQNVPPDRVCWSIDVGRALIEVDREVMPGTGALLLECIARRTPLEPHAAAKQLGIPAFMIEPALEAGVWRFRAKFRPFGELEPGWRETA